MCQLNIASVNNIFKCHARMPCVLRWRCAWDERGSRNEKVVSSADTSSVTIFILHQSPFRFAVTLLQWKRLLTTKSAYTGPPTYFHSSSTTGFPLVPIRESAIFRARFLHASDDRLSRLRTHAHAITDRRLNVVCIVDLRLNPTGFEVTITGPDTVTLFALSWERFLSEEAFFAKENHRLCFLK